MKYRYMIFTYDGDIYGTNDEALAKSFNDDPEMIAIDVVEGKTLYNGEPIAEFKQ